MSPDRKPRRHRIRRGFVEQPSPARGSHYADCPPCRHVGGLFINRDGATSQFEEHVRTGKSLRNGEWS